MARTSKLTKKMETDICGYIENGNTYERACRLCNISEASFYGWKQKGEERKDIRYIEFLEAVKRADAKFLAYHVSKINEAAEEGIWTASAWLLERKEPDEFGRRYKLEHQGKMTLETFDIKLSEKEKEEYDKRMADFYGKSLFDIKSQK